MSLQAGLQLGLQGGAGVGSQIALVAVPAVPAAVGLVLALTALRWTGRREGAAVLLALASAAADLLLLALVRSGTFVVSPFLAIDVPGAGVELQVDALGRTTSLVVAVVLLAVVVVTGAGSLHDAVTDDDSGTSRPRLLGLLLLFASGMHTTVLAASLPALVIGWEVMGAASGLLVASAWKDRIRVRAGTTAFLTTRAADLGLFVAAGAALAGAGSLRLADLADGSAPYGSVVAVGVLVAAVGKSAQLPLSGWLSRAMLGPSPVSALLHSATMVAAGGYLLVRLAPVLAAHPGVASAAVVIGLLTGIVLGVVALGQSDVKQLLAASTSAQVSVVVVAGGLGAIAGGTAHLVAHALVKAALFLAAGLWLTSTGSRRLDDLRGIGRRRPVVGVGATIAALALAGLPPLPLWATKDLVLASTTSAELAHPVALPPEMVMVGLLLVTVLSGAYGARLVGVLWARSDPVDGADPVPSEALSQGGLRRSGAEVVVVTLAVLALPVSLLAVPGVEHWWTRLLADPGRAPTAGLMAVSAAAAALGALAAVLLADRAPGRALARATTGWFGLSVVLEQAGALSLPVSRRLGRWDDALHAGLVLGAGAAVRAISRCAARTDDATHAAVVVGSASRTTAVAAVAGDRDVRTVHGTVLAVAAGLRRLGAAARRPQTGLLHQYYFQLAAGAGVLLVLLLLVPT